MKKILNATSEFSIGDLRAHRRICRTVAGVSSFLMLATFSAPAFAAGTSVLGGDATLTGATRAALNTGSATDTYAQFVANAGAKSAVLDWSKFNIGAGKEMNFSGAGTTFFNLVDGAASKSQIDGLISGNGSVWVINPNGIAFGASSQVNVGGTFAAAAGNLSNADQLRDGTSTLPTFSSFDGSVSSASGSKFTADQVALMGKTVSAAGDFTGVSDLTIGAAGKMTVDEVADGRISVSVADFATDASEVGVELGDLQVGDTTYGYYGGNLTVRAGNAVKVSGDVVVGNTAYLTTKNGDVTVAKNGKLESVGIVGSVAVVTGMSDVGRGDITVDGEIRVDSDCGEIDLYAGYGVEGSGTPGDIFVKGAVSTGYNSYFRSFEGDIAVEGNVSAFMTQFAAAGDVDVSGSVDGYVVASGENVSLNANNNLNVYNVTAEGGDITLSAGGDVVGIGTLDAKEGLLEIKSEGGNINLTALDGATVYAGKISFVAEKGNVTANNELNKIDGIREITVSNGGTADVKAQNIVNVSGSQSSYVYKALESGTILVDGDLTAPVAIALTTQGGDIYVMKGCKVEATGDGAYVYLDASSDVTLSGSLKSQSTVDVYAGGNVKLTAESVVEAPGDISMVADADYDAVGSFLAAGRIASTDQAVALQGAGIDLRGGSVTAGWNVSIVSSGVGELNVAESVQAGESVQMQTWGGGISIGKAGAVMAKNGNVELLAGYADGSSADITIDGTVAAESSDGELYVQTAMSNGSEGNVIVNGSVSGGDLVMIRTDVKDSTTGSVTVNGEINSGNEIGLMSRQGDVTVNGNVVSSGTTGAIALQASQSGEIVLGKNANVAANQYVILKTENGDVRVMSGLNPKERGGYASVVDRSAVLKAGEMLIDINGSIGASDSYLPLAGKVYGKATGSAYVAAVEGTSIVGGENPGVLSSDGTIAWNAEIDIGTTFEVGGNLGLYTTQDIEANGAFVAGGDLTLSAGSFGNGDASYLQAGGVLSLNNVGKPAHPQIAYFESIDGVEPNINNQPNDTVIFVDGRLAGGNLKILNQFGANEAFMVSTPELKSTQGIFGNPTFLHSDLDVANPMEVSAIDYMLQETPRLTLDKDFPAEVDSHVDSVVVPEKDSIQFGRGAKTETPNEAADDKVAMVK